LDFDDERTLAKAAYMGQSWELRRWEDGKLTNLGFDLDGKKAFGKGVKWESYQYRMLRDDLLHPMDIADFPYRVDILVDGRKLTPSPFDFKDGKERMFVVPLNDGDMYAIQLENQTDRPTYVALFIDGACSIDKDALKEPEDLEVRRHWHLPPNSGERVVQGFYKIERDEKGTAGRRQYYNQFTIASREGSVSYGKSFEDRIGQITAIFYTVTMDGIEEPDDADLPVGMGLPRADFGTGLGDRKSKHLDFRQEGPRGIILAAVTLYYRTSAQIDALRRGDDVDPVANPILDAKAEGENGDAGRGAAKKGTQEHDVPP
jgi:hypothetical protein